MTVSGAVALSGLAVENSEVDLDLRCQISNR